MNFDLSTLKLHRGTHPSTPEYCVMEATAVYVGEQKKDRNVDAVSPVIESYARALNDALPDEWRQRLVAFIPRLPNTKGTPEQEQGRIWMAQDVATRVFAPFALRAAKLIAQAEVLEALPPVTTAETSRVAVWAAEAAKAEAAVWAAVWAAAREAPAAAAEAAARAAAWTELAPIAIDLLDRMIRVTEGA